jgi:hypothetical protein
MGDELVRKLRKINTREEYGMGRNLAEFRQWYYQQSPAERQAFKQKMRTLADSDKWACSEMSIVIRLKQDAPTLGGEARPSEILKAIGDWDEAEKNLES